jgi:SAM-dependent methyltransferase
MSIERLWTAARRFVPLQLYPLLAPVHRWRRSTQLTRQRADDQRYLQAHPTLVVPPAELRYNIGARYTIQQFLERGQRTVDDIEAALQSIGLSLDQRREFLDFGCGCGRLILALRARRPTLAITGCDVDERAIGWCERNLTDSRWVINDPLPPSPFADGSFDLIWCGSVFTHLDEDRQDRWLRELRRILKPDGILLASVHGSACWEPRLPSRAVARLKREGMLFARIGIDAGIHPDWYQVAWHTEEYVKRHWASVLEIRGYLPRRLDSLQDIVIAARPRDSPA